jgi:hypothetical protein
MNHCGLGSAGPVPRLLLDEGGGMERAVVRDGLADLPPDDAVIGWLARKRSASCICAS